MPRPPSSWRRWLAPVAERVGPAARLAAVDLQLARAWVKHRGAIESTLGRGISETYTELVLLSAKADPSVARVIAWALPDHLARVPEVDRARYGRMLLGVARQRTEALPLVMRTLPALLKRMDGAPLARYVARALELHTVSSVRAESFLRLESQEAQATAEKVQGGLALADIQRTLSLYARAHCGEDVHVKATAAGQRAFSDGRHIYLPERVDTFADDRDFLVYRVLTARNAGYIEFGTLDLRLDALPWGGEDPHLRPQEGPIDTGGRPDWPEPRDGELELERMLRGFPNASVARDLFTILENARVEAALRHEYPGIARDLDQLGADWRPERPDLETLAPAEQAVELLARLALGHDIEGAPVGEPVQRALSLAARALDAVQTPGASVQVTATALWTAYLPVVAVLRYGDPEAEERIEPPDESPGGAGGGSPGAQDDAGEADPAGAPDPRGTPGGGSGEEDPDADYQPMAADPTAGTLDTGPLSEQERAVEARARDLLQAMADPDAADLKDSRAEARRQLKEEASYEEMAAMLDRMAADAPAGPAQEAAEAPESDTISAATGRTLDADTEARGETFRYPEWDAAVGDHKPDWVRVTEYRLDSEGSGDFVQQVQDEHGPLIQRVRRAFEALRPEALRRRRGLTDGDEIDLDRAIAERIAVRAGDSADGRIYQRRRPRDRDVSIAFLVDMSSSTNEVVKRGGKRVIEVEKEALVLTAEAVAAIGDTCAIWGFSGYGRDQVAFYEAKAFADPWDDAARARLGRMSWKMENRDGAAIRHATKKMLEWPAKVRLLMLLSDGRPLDCGCDHYADRYAQEDTRMALQEARQQGVHPFCITVDPGGSGYLERIYGAGGYTVITEVDALPERLTRTYRRLTR